MYMHMYGSCTGITDNYVVVVVVVVVFLEAQLLAHLTSACK